MSSLPSPSRRNRIARSRVALSFAAATTAALLARRPAVADGNVATYTGVPAGNWIDPTVWDIGTVPANGDFAYVFASGTSAAVLTFDSTAGFSGNLAAVIVDRGAQAGAGSSIQFNQTGGSFAADSEYVGFSGPASLTIAGGSHNVGNGSNGAGSLYIGMNAGSAGTVSLGSAASLGVGGNTYVGYGGAGTLTQTGGSHSTFGLVLGSSAGGSGTYALSGSDATLNVNGSETIGDAGSGAFTQAGGAHYAYYLTLGGSTGGSGSYSLSGGAASLNVYGTETVGGSGTGTFNQTAGLHQTGALVVGQANSGTFTLGGTGGLTVNGSETIGSGAAGSFTQTGGTHTAGSLSVGSAAAGSYALSGANSSLSVLGGVIVGDSATGSFTQSAGSHKAAWLALGNSPGGNGAYTLSGGSATFGDVGVGGNPYFNGGGVGSLVINAGSLKVNNSLTTYAGGTVTLAGGTLTANAIFTDPTSGPIRWTAGALNVTAATPFTIGAGGPIGSAVSIGSNKMLSVGGTLAVAPGGSLGLSGGTVTAAAIDLSAVGSSAFTWSTGTLNLTGTAGASVDPAGSLGSSFALATGQSLHVTGPMTVGATGTATFNQTGGQHTAQSLDLGASAGASGTYAMSNGASLTVATKAYIGDGGQGVLNLTGGTMTVNNGANAVYLGYHPGSSGSVNISGGGTLNASDVYVGYAGSGAVNQTGGNHLLNGFLVLGGQPDGSGGATASGSYNLSGGQLNANTVYVGLSGTGTFSQSGGNSTLGQITAGYFAGASGTVTVSGTANVFEAGPEIYGDNGTGTFIQTGGSQLNAGVTLGNGATGAGTATFSGGVMTVSGVTLVGNNGHGTFYQTGGTHAPSNFYVGLAATGVGYYSLSNNSTLHVTSDFSGNNQFNGTEYIGYYGNATFDQTGGSHTVDSYFAIAYAFGSSATYNLAGGSFSAGSESIGYLSTANNTFNQTAGSNSTNGYLTVGDQASGRGTYNLSGANSTLSASALYDAWAGLGTLNQSGGTATVGTLFIAHESSANSAYNLSAGTLNVSNAEIIGYSGRGTFTQTGGVHAVAGTATVTIAQQGGSVGTYNLLGGSFRHGPVVNNGSLNLFGGSATIGTLSGSGTTTLTGTNAAATTVTLASFAQSKLSVANNTLLNLKSSATPATNTTGLLTLSGSGTLDLANNHLLTTNTPLAQVRSYIAQSRNGGTWTGVGGLTSSTVRASPITFGMAYFSGANPANATLAAVPGMSNPNAVFVRPAQIGDFNGDGVVDRFDIRQFNTRGTFNDGGTNHDWADGDLNNDGVVDRFDIRAFNTAGNFNNGVNFAAAQSATLTAKASATPAVAPINSPTTVGITGDGKPDLVYDPSTGDVIFKYDGFVPPAASPLVEMEIDSAKGSLRPDNASPTVAGSLTTSADGKLIDFANLGPTAIADGVDLGQIFPTNSNALALTSGDISVSLFLYHDQTGSSYFADVVGGTAGVPEPTSLALLGVAAAGLLGRRRKRRQ